VTTRTDRITGSTLGLAYGDAWGYVTEFSQPTAIRARYGAAGPRFPTRARVSDDTQMALALVQGLDAWYEADDDDYLPHVADAFLDWRVDKDNNRAPGGTCMGALGALDAHTGCTRLGEHSLPDSKGCGTVMRAPWLGLLNPRFVTDAKVASLAIRQSLLTHGHPAAGVAAAVTALVTRYLADELATSALQAAQQAWAYLASARTPEGIDELLEVASRRGQSAQAYWDQGLTEVGTALARAVDGRHELAANPWGIDPCALAGDGWAGDEAVAVACLIADVFVDSPTEALRRSMLTRGDSDSIGALVGAFLGAQHGNVWPSAWHGQLEARYVRELAAAANVLD